MNYRMLPALLACWLIGAASYTPAQTTRAESSNGYDESYVPVSTRTADQPGWRMFTSANSPLPNNGINVIAVDRNNVGWIGTYRGLARFDGTTWTRFTRQNGFPDSTAVTAIAIDSSDRVWVATLGALLSYDGITWTRHDIPDDFLFYGRDRLVCAPNGDIWIAGKGLRRYRDGVWTQYDDPFGRRLEGVAVDRGGTIWCGGRMGTGPMTDGIASFDGVDWMFHAGSTIPLNLELYRSLTVDPQGNLWYLDVNGAAKFDGAWTGYPSIGGGRPTFPGPCPSAMAFDPRGVIWIGSGSNGGTYGKGLIRYEGGRSWYYTMENSGLPENDIMTVTAAGDGMIWVGTYGNGFAILDGTLPPEQLYAGISGVAGRGGREELAVEMIPNPARDVAGLRLELPVAGHVRASIVDLLGVELAIPFEGMLDAGDRVLPFDLSAMPAGWYLLRVQAGDESRAVPIRVGG